MALTQIQLAMLQDGILTADAAGRLKMADGFVNTAKILDASVTATKLAAGVGGTGPAFSASLGSDQTIVNATTWTKLTIATEDFDTNSCYDTSNYRFQPTVAGYYQINFSGVMNSLIQQNNNGAFAFYKNGSSFRSWMYVGAGAVAQNNEVGTKWNITSAMIIYMNGSSDYVECYAWQTYGGSGMSILGGATFSGSLVRNT